MGMIDIFFGCLPILIHVFVIQFEDESSTSGVPSDDQLVFRSVGWSGGANVANSSSSTKVTPNAGDVKEELGVVEGPDMTGQFPCGYKHTLAWHYMEQNRKKYPFYYLNSTAKRLRDEGFKVTVLGMFYDAISNMTYSNDTYSDNFAFDGFGAVAAVGGRPALHTRAYYMAQLGIKRSEEILWVCDGALINSRWVLSAGHCFFNDNASPNMLRLGDYDVSVPPEKGLNPNSKFVEDYFIYDVIFHPDYTGDEWYHDLVLIPLDRPIPQKSNSINPICLPFDNPPDPRGKTLVLTGWGATRFRGPKTPLLQEVELEMFNISVCNKSYSSLANFRKHYPTGLDDDLLCVGWAEGGKDACGGDSGGPLVLDREDDIVLLGIVSSGFGCGKKDFPGLYVDIRKPKYLEWIKEIAFKDYL